MPGRINYIQLGKYGSSCEQRYCQDFSKDFDWLDFNVALFKRVLTRERKSITIDPIYNGRQSYSLGRLFLVRMYRYDKERQILFSTESHKAMIHNAYLLERFICVSGIKPNKRLNDKLFKELVEFAAMAT